VAFELPTFGVYWHGLYDRDYEFLFSDNKLSTVTYVASLLRRSMSARIASAKASTRFAIEGFIGQLDLHATIRLQLHTFDTVRNVVRPLVGFQERAFLVEEHPQVRSCIKRYTPKCLVAIHLKCFPTALELWVEKRADARVCEASRPFHAGRCVGHIRMRGPVRGSGIESVAQVLERQTDAAPV
jgi:hypothetical protein